jgi:hypothetical protein
MQVDFAYALGENSLGAVADIDFFEASACVAAGVFRHGISTPLHIQSVNRLCKHRFAACHGYVLNQRSGRPNSVLL